MTRRRQIQFESDQDKDKEIFRATMQALKDIAWLILLGVASVIGMIWIAIEGRAGGW